MADNPGGIVAHPTKQRTKDRGHAPLWSMMARKMIDVTEDEPEKIEAPSATPSMAAWIMRPAR